VGHEHDRAPLLLAEVEQLLLEQRPQLGVEGGEGLVHQQDLGLDGEGAGDGDPLAHAAREGVGPGVGELREAHALEPRGHPLVGLAAGDAGDVEAEADVGRHRLPRVDAVVLEDHRRRVGDVGGDPHLAGARAQQPGDDPQEGGLPAARRADDRDELAVGHVEVDGAQRLDDAAPPTPAEGAADVAGAHLHRRGRGEHVGVLRQGARGQHGGHHEVTRISCVRISDRLFG
jgi:hypothetical protein